MLKYVSVGVAAIACAGAAHAQDAASDTSWAGPYVGVHGGYGFDSGSSISDRGITQNNLDALALGVRPRSLDQNRGTALFGGQAGFNLQSGRLVYGVEGDFSYLTAGGRSEFRGVPAAAGEAGRRTLVHTDVDWMGSARARVGYTLGQGMIYATGGYAFGRVKGRAEFDAAQDATVNYAGRHKYTAQGWTAGAGVEFKPFTGEGMLSRVSVRAETSYYDLGRSHIYALQTADRPGYYVLGRDTRGWNGKLGINYGF